jgi:hypothetical protein
MSRERKSLEDFHATFVNARRDRRGSASPMLHRKKKAPQPENRLTANLPRHSGGVGTV